MTSHSLDDLHISLSPSVAALHDELIAVRRALHASPELSGSEHRTKQFVLERLASFGIKGRPIGKTGVTALIEGREPGRVLLLRADMDALPIEEENDAPYRSANRGAMHACGHDAHTAMLLASAKLLADRGLERGAVKLLFQPAEEVGNGAQQMIDAGILESPAVDASLTFHVWSQYGIGQVIAREGPAMAGLFEFRITVTGRGVHAATPEEGIDPVVAACQIVSAAQTLVSRKTSPHDAAVLSFTAVNAGSAYNVIPDEVVILGTIRFFRKEVGDAIRDGLAHISASIATAMGATARLEVVEENDPVVNHAGMASMLRETAGEVVGADRVVLPHPVMPGEDIGLIHQRVPGVIAFLGCGAADGTSYPHHHPRFDIDERVLPIGVQIAQLFVRRFLDGPTPAFLSGEIADGAVAV